MDLGTNQDAFVKELELLIRKYNIDEKYRNTNTFLAEFLVAQLNFMDISAYEMLHHEETFMNKRKGPEPEATLLRVNDLEDEEYNG